MALRFSTKLRNNMLDNNGIKNTFQDGVIYIYSGPQPASADDGVQGTLLGKVSKDGGNFSFGDPTYGLEFDTPVDGVLNKAAAENWKFVGEANGTAGWFRFMQQAPADTLAEDTAKIYPRIDGSIGTFGAELNLSNVTIVIGAPNTVDVFRLTMSESV